MNAPTARPPLTHLRTYTQAKLWWIGFVAIFVILLAGCAPLEVNVSDAGSQPAESTGAGEQAPADEERGAEVDPLTENVLTTGIAYLAIFAEICAAFAITFGIIRALVQFLGFVFQRGRGDGPQDDIRLQLGRTLALALEFALAADILKTAVAPTWDIIAQLAAIIVLRTLLNYFLERELRQVENRRAGTHIEEPAAR